MVDGISRIIIKSSLEAVSKLSSQDVPSSTAVLGYYVSKKLIGRFHGRVDGCDSTRTVEKSKRFARQTRRRRAYWLLRDQWSVIYIQILANTFLFIRDPEDPIFHAVSHVGNIRETLFTQLRFLRYYNSSIIHAERNSPALFHNFSPARVSVRPRYIRLCEISSAAVKCIRKR